jgi:hypothetical protein
VVEETGEEGGGLMIYSYHIFLQGDVSFEVGHWVTKCERVGL